MIVGVDTHDKTFKLKNGVDVVAVESQCHTLFQKHH